MSKVGSFIKWSLAGIYVLGYFAYVIMAGIYSWNTDMTFWDWTNYMVWQITLYGLAWPFFI